jgi:hypothetical protein
MRQKRQLSDLTRHTSEYCTSLGSMSARMSIYESKLHELYDNIDNLQGDIDNFSNIDASSLNVHLETGYLSYIYLKTRFFFNYC